MFDCLLQGCRAFSLFEAPVVEVPIFSHLAVLDVFRLIPGLMMRKLLGFLKNFQMMGIASLFAACNLFILPT